MVSGESLISEEIKVYHPNLDMFRVTFYNGKKT